MSAGQCWILDLKLSWTKKILQLTKIEIKIRLLFLIVFLNTYSYLDQTPDEMNAKGEGGLRQMHNYCAPLTEDTIETPPDNYSPDKIGENGLDMDRIIQDREKEIQQQKKRSYGLHRHACSR